MMSDASRLIQVDGIIDVSLTPKAFSVPQLAKRWGCSDGLVYKLVKEGRLQCFRPGTLIQIAATEVERYENPAP